jgi:hypothetical protein
MYSIDLFVGLYKMFFVLREVRILLQIQDITNTVFITEKMLLALLHKRWCYSKSVFLTVCLENKFTHSFSSVLRQVQSFFQSELSM